MTDLWNSLLNCLALRSLSPDDTDSAAPQAFEGSNLPLDYHRIFGGQLLAQFVRAAALSSPGKTVKSLHTLFPREGRLDEPVRYEVQRHHEGRAFATLTVVARQSHGVIATAAVSLHSPEDGPVHQAAVSVPELPGPEFNTAVDLLPWSLRSTIDLDVRDAQAPEYDLWMRTPQVAPDAAPALAAYATDLTLIGTGLRQVEGVCQQDAGKAFVSGVTAHTVWFHRAFRTENWLLLHQYSPVLAHGRCFGRGDLITRGGTLVASYAQEALLRFRSDGERHRAEVATP